jgi:hypothetical protein
MVDDDDGEVYTASLSSRQTVLTRDRVNHDELGSLIEKS